MPSIDGKSDILIVLSLNNTENDYMIKQCMAQKLQSTYMHSVGHKKCGNLLLFISSPIIDRFLRVTAECFARLSHRLGVCLSVRLSVHLSVCHTRDLYQNGAS